MQPTLAVMKSDLQVRGSEMSFLNSGEGIQGGGRVAF